MVVSLQATIRPEKEKIEKIKKQGLIPAVLYGEDTKNTLLVVPSKEFEKVFNEAGETSIISLDVEGKKTDVLIHQVSKDFVSGKAIHIDFFHPSSKKKIEAEIELVFEGESEAVKSTGGILIKELKELKVKGLAKDLPKEVVVDISVLKTLEDRILIKDLSLPKNIEVVGRHSEDIVAHISLPKEEQEMKAPEATAGGEVLAPEEKDEEK